MNLSQEEIHRPEAGSNTRHRMMLRVLASVEAAPFQVEVTGRCDLRGIASTRSTSGRNRAVTVAERRASKTRGPLLGHAYVHTVMNDPSRIAYAEMALVSPCQ